MGGEMKKMMRGSSAWKLRMVGFLSFSLLIIAQIKLSPPLISLFSSSSSSSSSGDHLILRLSLSPNHSETTPTNQSSPEARGEMKPDPLLWPSSRPPIASQIKCDRTAHCYDFCSINGPTVLDPTTSTFFVMGSERSNRPNIFEKIKPSPRKFDQFLMPRVKNITIISGPISPPCQVQHNVPALVFSIAGYMKNFWHAFNDGFVPLFITVNTVFPNGEDFVIVITEGPDWWAPRYADILKVFTKQPIITLKNENITHCFPSAHVGLISHGFMEINPTLIPNSKTYMHFRDVFCEAFESHHHSQTLSLKSSTTRPRLLFASRKGAITRAMLNKREAIRIMKKVGFDVVLFEPNKNTSLRESYALVSSSHAMIGIHGAALTHSVFLKPGSILMQIVPIGLEWVAQTFFGRVAKGIKLEYMEYKIKPEESSLAKKYGKDSLMVRDPTALQKGGWPPELMNIYLLDQNVTLDLDRFREYIQEGYKKAKMFMHKEGDGI
ncbi:alpha-1,3-arabinosyltransferase XAT3-like isoform X2 [Neltuma alba]|uniref:alpha-1,3-arabinosyltransferase XAT3-like isoform X2 n=1 Tax=Neltuma alba TaxID=207710 RepID=UPI0010A4972C|nr:alpha-1,3-arabinosyltransferase XAT3-like isoform X2 [Prosopis alba]